MVMLANSPGGGLPAKGAPSSRAAAPATPGGGVSLAPLTASQLLNAARSEAAATTQGPLAQLAQEIAAQNRQTANATSAVSNDFQGLGNYVNQAAGQVQGVGQNLDSQLGNLQTTAQNSLSAYTPKGDPDVGSAGMPGLVTALTEQRGLADQQQAGYQDLLGGLAGSFAKAGQQDLANVAQAGQSAVAPLASKIATEEGQRPALVESDLAKLRQQEITNSYDQQKLNEAATKDNATIGIDEAALGIKQQSANTASRNAGTSAAKAKSSAAYQQSLLGIDQQKVTNSATQNAAMNAYRQGLLNLDKQKVDTAASNAASLAAYRQAELKLKQGTGGVTPLTANENNRMLNYLGEAVAASRTLSKTQNPSQIMNGLTTGSAQLQLQGGKFKTISAIPRPVVQAALEVMQTGNISHQTYTVLHQMGIRGLPFKVAAPVK